MKGARSGLRAAGARPVCLRRSRPGEAGGAENGAYSGLMAVPPSLARAAPLPRAPQAAEKPKGSSQAQSQLRAGASGLRHSAAQAS